MTCTIPIAIYVQRHQCVFWIRFRDDSNEEGIDRIIISHRITDYTIWEEMFLPLNIWTIYLSDIPVQADCATRNESIQIKISTYL